MEYKGSSQFSTANNKAVDEKETGNSDDSWVPGKVATAIETRLTAKFAPEILKVEDESHKHAGHAGMIGAVRSGETHFKVQIVSLAFEGVSLIERHRSVNECLKSEIQAGIHALSIDAKTPKQWATKQAKE